MAGLSAGMTSTPRTPTNIGTFPGIGSTGIPTTGAGPRVGLGGPGGNAIPPPPQFSPGPFGTAYQYNPGGIWGGTADASGNIVGAQTTRAGWYPVEKPRTQQDQINEEMQLAQLRRMNLENDMLTQGFGVPTTGTRSGSSSSSSSATGTAPSVTALKHAIETLQPGDEPKVPGPNVPGTQVAAPKPADNAAAVAAAYARAKDTIASEGAAAGKALEGAMTARGISGTGLEAKGRKDITRASLRQLGEVARQQAMSDVQREDEFAKLGYTGGIQQRGQDIQALLARYASDITQRGQNINAQYNPLGYIGPLTALSMAGGSLY